MSTNVAPNDFVIPEIPSCLQLYVDTISMTSFAEAKKLSYKEAAHICLWARQEGSSDCGELRAAVMMHLRYDGTFGFPGGFIDEGEDVIEGINRELMEEICWDPAASPVTWRDYYNSQVVDDSKLVLHFFIKELTLQQYCALEQTSPRSADYGKEVMGTVRVPLYTMSNMYNGLPAFLDNKFVGRAKQQLLLSLYHIKVLSEKEITELMHRSQNLKLLLNQFLK